MTNEHFKTIDILKGIAMMMIILCHLQQSFSSIFNFLSFGQMGCQIFFVVSGFCLTYSYKKKPKKILSFYKSRYLSIAPAFYISIILTFIIRTILLSFDSKAFSISENYQIFPIICNFLLIHGFFTFSNSLLPGAWYVGTLVIMYLTFPAVVCFFDKKRRHPVLVWFILSTAAITTLLIGSKIIFGESIIYNNTFRYFCIFNQFPCFCIGILLYYNIFEKETKNNSSISLTCCIGFFALSVISFFYNTKFSYVISPVSIGIFTYFLLKIIMRYEIRKDFLVLKFLKYVGRKSLYFFFGHTFVVWDVPYRANQMLSNMNCNIYIMFFVMLTAVLILTFFIAFLLEKTTKSFIGLIKTTKEA